MDATLFNTIANFGLGAVFGFIMLLIYRADRQKSAEDLTQLHREHQSEVKDMTSTHAAALALALSRQLAQSDKMLEIIAANTEALRNLQTVVATVVTLRSFGGRDLHP